MLHLCELQALPCVFVVERDRGICGKIGSLLRPIFPFSWAIPVGCSWVMLHLEAKES